MHFQCVICDRGVSSTLLRGQDSIQLKNKKFWLSVKKCEKKLEKNVTVVPIALPLCTPLICDTLLNFNFQHQIKAKEIVSFSCERNFHTMRTKKKR